MPSVNEILKKHAPRVKSATKDKPRVERKGATRPWQEGLDEYKQKAPAEPTRDDQKAKSDGATSADEVAAPKAATVAAAVDKANKEEVAASPTPISEKKAQAATTTSLSAAAVSAPTQTAPKIEDLEAATPKAKASVAHPPVPSSVSSTTPRSEHTPLMRMAQHAAPEPARPALTLAEPKAAGKLVMQPVGPELSSSAKDLVELISIHGFDTSMKLVLLRSLANDEGLIQCSQLFLAGQLKVNLKSVKRLFDDLCERGLIELFRESDPSTKSPREYRIVRVAPRGL